MVKKEKIKEEMTEEGKLGESYKNELKKICKNRGKEPEKVFDAFVEGFNLDKVSEKFGDEWEKRADYAMTYAKGVIADEITRPTEDVEVLILGKEAPVERERRDGSGTVLIGRVRGLGISENIEDIKRINIVGYQEEARNVEQLEMNKSYEMNLERQGVAGDEVQYQFLEKTEIEETDFKPDNPEDMLEQFFPLIDMAEASKPKYKEGDDKPTVMVKGNIRDMIDGIEMGGNLKTIYNVYDDSMSLDKVEEQGNLFGAKVDVAMAQWGKNTEALFIGEVSETEDYGIGMWVDYVYPIIPIERKQPQDTPEQEITADDAQEIDEDMEAEVEVDDDDFDDFM